jgi:HEPN domain-containing protein
MKRQTRPWVRKAEEDVRAARALAAENPPLRDIVCFHCQQAVEKYLKALLQELGVAFPKTHDLELLVDLILPHDATIKKLRPRADALTSFAVEYRYPIVRATSRQMKSALRTMERARTELSGRLGLPP